MEKQSAKISKNYAPIGLTQDDLAKALGVSIEELIK